jgi:serine/threonine protein kinase/alpha-tubulin suppressor-like RCC1 family protein
VNIGKTGRSRRQAREAPRSEAKPPGGATADERGASVVPGAAFVGAAGEDVYYWVGSRGWQHIPPLERVWFPSEEAAQEAGYRRAASAWEPLDEFEIMGELGRGATSVVYHGWDRGLGREVAIKVIQSHFGSDPETSLRFALEARLLASLRHPNIVSAFAVKQIHGGGFALVMEYVRGQTLREVIQREGRLPPERVERILRDVASALAAAHQHDIVHRDVKPDNVFLEESTGRALLADFGIAVNLDNPSGLTMMGTAVGTPNYMSPEQIDGRLIDRRSDLYSLALIGWEMLAGQKPWDGESLYSVIYKQKHENLPSLRRLRPDVPVRLAYAIEGALAKDPGARQGSAEEFIAQLSDRSLLGRWRQLSSVVLWKRRTSARVVAAKAKIQNAARETVKTVYFRRPQHRPLGEPTPNTASPARDGAGSRGVKRGRGRILAFSAAAVVVLLAVPAGLPTPFTPPPMPEASADLPGEAPRAGGGEGAAVTSPPSLEPGGSPAPLDVVAAADSVVAPLSEPALAALLLPSASDTPPLTPPEAPPPTSDATLPPVELEEEGAEAEPPPPAAAPAASILLPVARTRSQITAGGMHTCQIDSGQGVVCWGGNDRGQLGLGAPRRASTGLPVPSLSGIMGVEAGGFHTCALRALGTVLCWGENGDGQLGGGTSAAVGLVRISSVRFTAVSLGTAHSCGVSSDGVAYCWGSNASGQLGEGTSAARRSPTPVLLEGAVAVLSAGWNHTCAVTRQGRGLCWGENESGQLGDGTTFDRFAPVSIEGDPTLRSIAGGSSHTCALTVAWEVLCWGQNGSGQLGDGSTTDRHSPVRIATGTRIVQISAGGRHTCALDAAGAAWCWGQNTYGQLGDGSTVQRTTPTRVATDVRFATIRSSGAHTCAVSAEGESWCWGYNVEGQVGDGTETHRATPQRVAR